MLRAFADLDDDVEFPDFPYGPAVGIIVDAEGASAFRGFIESGATRASATPATAWAASRR